MVNGMNFLFHADSPLFGHYSEIIPRRNTGDKVRPYFSFHAQQRTITRGWRLEGERRGQFLLFLGTKGTVPFV